MSILDAASGAATLKLKLVIGAIVIAIIAAGVLAWNNKNKTIDKLKEVVVADKIEKGSMVDTIAKKEISEKIDEKINTQVATDTSKVESDQQSIRDKMISDISNIEKNRQIKKVTVPSSPTLTNIKIPVNPNTVTNQPTESDTTIEDTQTSTVMIDAMWDSYCTGVPNSTKCKKS